MKIFKNQVLMSTHEDSHGERFDLAYLQDFVSRMPTRVRLNDQHELANESVGFVENIRIEPVENEPGQYQVRGDVSLNEGVSLAEGMGGFSFSALGSLVENCDEPEIAVFLPYPVYNDNAGIQSLLALSLRLKVGKWIKKSADPTTLALIVLALTPIWDAVFKDQIYPRIKTLFERVRKTWGDHVGADSMFVVDIKVQRFKLYLAGDTDARRDLPDAKVFEAAIHDAESVARSERSQIKLIRSIWDSRHRKYVPTYMELEDGSEKHLI